MEEGQLPFAEAKALIKPLMNVKLVDLASYLSELGDTRLLQYARWILVTYFDGVHSDLKHQIYESVNGEYSLSKKHAYALIEFSQLLNIQLESYIWPAFPFEAYVEFVDNVLVFPERIDLFKLALVPASRSASLSSTEYMLWDDVIPLGLVTSNEQNPLMSNVMSELEKTLVPLPFLPILSNLMRTNHLRDIFDPFCAVLRNLLSILGFSRTNVIQSALKQIPLDVDRVISQSQLAAYYQYFLTGYLSDVPIWFPETLDDNFLRTLTNKSGGAESLKLFISPKGVSINAKAAADKKSRPYSTNSKLLHFLFNPNESIQPDLTRFKGRSPSDPLTTGIRYVRGAKKTRIIIVMTELTAAFLSAYAIPLERKMSEDPNFPIYTMTGNVLKDHRTLLKWSGDSRYVSFFMGTDYSAFDGSQGPELITSEYAAFVTATARQGLLLQKWRGADYDHWLQRSVLVGTGMYLSVRGYGSEKLIHGPASMRTTGSRLTSVLNSLLNKSASNWCRDEVNSSYFSLIHEQYVGDDAAHLYVTTSPNKIDENTVMTYVRQYVDKIATQGLEVHFEKTWATCATAEFLKTYFTHGVVSWEGSSSFDKENPMQTTFLEHFRSLVELFRTKGERGANTAFLYDFLVAIWSRLARVSVRTRTELLYVDLPPNLLHSPLGGDLCIDGHLYLRGGAILAYMKLKDPNLLLDVDQAVGQYKSMVIRSKDNPFLQSFDDGSQFGDAKTYLNTKLDRERLGVSKRTLDSYSGTRLYDQLNGFSYENSVRTYVGAAWESIAARARQPDYGLPKSKTRYTHESDYPWLARVPVMVPVPVVLHPVPLRLSADSELFKLLSLTGVSGNTSSDFTKHSHLYKAINLTPNPPLKLDVDKFLRFLYESKLANTVRGVRDAMTIIGIGEAGLLLAGLIQQQREDWLFHDSIRKLGLNGPGTIFINAQFLRDLISTSIKNPNPFSGDFKYFEDTLTPGMSWQLANIYFSGRLSVVHL